MPFSMLPIRSLCMLACSSSVPAVAARLVIAFLMTSAAGLPAFAAVVGAPSPAGTPATSAPSPMSIELRAPEVDLGGDITLLPDSASVRLEAALDHKRLEAYGLRLQRCTYDWSHDGGAMAENTFSPFNAWLPPDNSKVSAVRVVCEARLQSLSDPTRLYGASCSAVKSFLSRTRPEQYRGGNIADPDIGSFEIGYYADPTLSDKFYDSFKVPIDKRSKYPGMYPQLYQPPSGFYKVTKDDVDRRISQNFTLRFFAMDYPWLTDGFPQYVAIDLRLVRKLEDLLALMRQSGFHIATFVPIYGFRRPAYNMESIVKEGNENLKAPFSMHQYGRAVDMIIDEDDDLRMDDLNRDGTIDVYDAAELMKYVNVLDAGYRAAGSDLVGGAGLYDHHDFFNRPVQSPYVHVDVRGYMAKDRRLIRWPWKDGASWPNGEVIAGLENLRPQPDPNGTGAGSSSNVKQPEP